MNQSLRSGHELVAIPGPSVVPDRVLSAMHRAMPNIYEGELIDVSLSVLEDLAGLARTSGTAFVALANGHGAWEMAITNTLSRGDKVLVLESGRFAVAWGEMAAFSGVEVAVLHGPRRGPVDPAAVEARLAADRRHEIAAVLVVQIDTATSVVNDIAGDPGRHGSRRAPGVAHGGLHRLTGLHALRDGPAGASMSPWRPARRG